MLRLPQLPPRCPNPKTNSSTCDPSSSLSCQDKNTRHQKSISQSFVPEEHPAWLDDLLGDWDPNIESKSHRRAASDSGTVLDDLVKLPILNREKDDKSSCSSEFSTTATALESAYIYGPNSPRSKEKVSFQESAIASALSGYASKSPLQYVNADLSVSGFPQPNSVQDACGSAGEVNTEAKPLKRHSGQRSRVRKVQYIAELERTVENFQSMVSELAVRVDSLVEQRVYLSLENKQLKQQLARMQQEKKFMNCEYQSMRIEVEGLKLGLPFSGRSYSVGATEALCQEPTWHMLDMGKLHIN